VRYSGETFTNDANTRTLDSYTLVDLRVSYPIDDHLELYGRVENLFDERISVTDAQGNTPNAYQPHYLDPLGRTFRINFRKIIF